MSQTRKLAAIMFTDIKGYTALMQSDEAKALRLRKRHREVFEGFHQTYNGTILQYYGDGTLSIFDSALDAAKCAIEIQKELNQGEIKIPLRIGLHTGDVIYSETEVIGDGVNVASRVESMAEAGSVMVSDKFYDYIKNQKEISTVSMGHFNFKNVKEPMEVFALKDEGLVMPNPREVQRNFKKKHGITWWKKAQERKVPQIVGSYLAGVLVFVLLLSLARNFLSIPQYVSTLTWTFFLSLLPSVIIYAYHHGKTTKGPWTLTEKLTIPTNLGLTGVLLFSFFTNQGLIAATETITVQREDGTTEVRKIIKANYQKKFYVTSFNNESDTSLYDWMGLGIPYALEMDWDQDSYILNIYEEEKKLEQFSEQIEAAKNVNCPMLLTGSFEVADSGYYIHPKMYNTNTGQLTQKWDFFGKDLLKLLDEVSLQVKKDLGIPEEHLAEVLDYTIEQQLTNSLEAYKQFCFGINGIAKWQFGPGLQSFNKAVELDPTFAMASFYVGHLHHQLSMSKIKAEEAIAQAMEHRKRLSETLEMNVRMLNYKIEGHEEKALKLGEMMAELRPTDADLQINLSVQYRLSNKYDKALEAIKRFQVLREDPTAYIDVELYLLNRLGKTKEGIKKGEKFLKDNQKNLQVTKQLAKLYLVEEEYDKAEKLFERGSFFDAANKSWDYFIQHTQFMKDSANFYTSDLREAYIGPYKIELREAILDITHTDNMLFMHLMNQPNAQLFPINHYTFLVEFSGSIIKFKQNTDGETDRFLLSEKEGPFFNCFKETKKFHDVLDFIENKKYTEAAQSLEALIEKYPTHYYLPNYLNHVKYLQENSDLSSNAWKEYEGNYTVQDFFSEISIKDNQPYIVFPRSTATLDPTPLLPIGKDEFMIPTGYDLTFEFERKGGKIVSLSLINKGEVRLSMEKD